MSDSRTEEIVIPLYYDDAKVIHACESCFMHLDIRLAWTKCDRDVPPNTSFTVKGGVIDVTWNACRKVAGTADAAA
jgi:hypothetical protein